jgi:predicted phage terminase large subunit-like protein
MKSVLPYTSLRKRHKSLLSDSESRLTEIPPRLKGIGQALPEALETRRKHDIRQVRRLLHLVRKRVRARKAGQIRSRLFGKKPEPNQHRGPSFTRQELERSLARDSFYDFVRIFWDVVIAEKPVWNWHIRYLCEQLQLVAERIFEGKGKLYDLVVNIPPGTTKSTIISVMLPVWCWVNMPSCRYIGASYSETLALDLSLKSRDIVQSERFQELFPEIKLREDQNTKTYFKNTHGGYRYAVGVNGTVTGMHAHVIAIDDPLDPLKSRSDADLKTVNYWIDRQLSNRKVDKKVSVMILVMQRLHQDDPTTLFLKRRKVRHVCLPAEDGPNVRPSEVRAMYKSGLLDADRLDSEVLKEEKQKGGQYYASQFLQDPVPAEGERFKVNRLKHGSPPDKWQNLVRSWDKAGTAAGGAFTVGTLLGLDTDGRFWVLDVTRFRHDSFEREQLIRRTAELDGYKVRVVVEQEPGSGGKESAENTATRTLRGYRVTIIKVDKTTGGKEERADPWSVQVNAGNVYLPEHQWDVISNSWKDWAENWVEEHKYFPFGRYKDQVDSAALAFSVCGKRKVQIGGIGCLTPLV